MKNPLRKRIPRELLKDWKKYLAMFLVMTLTIGFISGVFVANDSMQQTAADAYEKYNIEDGHFILKDQADDALVDAFEERGIRVWPQFYKDLEEDINGDGAADAKVRVYTVREEVNRACLMEGTFPASAGEIMLDRMHAKNRNILVGDTISLNGQPFTVCGLHSLSDYSALFEKNSDTMFDALTFNIATVTAEGYASLDAQETYEYVFQYPERPKDDAEKKKLSDELVSKLAVLAATGGLLDDVDEADRLEKDIEEWTDYLEEKQKEADALKARGDALKAEGDALEAESDQIDATVEKLEELEPYEERMTELTDYVPEYAAQSIHYAPEDMGADKAMGEVVLIILVAVLAFIFAITASNTITNEASVIGTLRASGYKKSELLRHYMAVPVLVTLWSAVIGNVLGYTAFKYLATSLYYNSYSLPAYETVWSANAFIKTTVYPVLLTIAINFLVIVRKLRFTPLQFLRRNLSNSRRKRALKLPDWKFMRRFRLRILLQNLSGYLTLFIGILFVVVLLSFAAGLPASLKKYQDNAKEYLIADYQLVLKGTEDEDGETITTSAPDAERYSVGVLKSSDQRRKEEDVTVYGYMKESRYFDLPDSLPEDRIFISVDYADKFALKKGEELRLKERYENKTYHFVIEDVYEAPGLMAVFMPNENFNRIFDYDEGSFTGYLSGTQITDIDEKYIASEITVEDTLKMAKQLDHSIGAFMNVFEYVCVFIAMLILFLLTKLIIEKNSTSISMVKVLGYSRREISGLYIRMTTIVVVVSTVAAAFLARPMVAAFWKMVMYRMSGWIRFYTGPAETVRTIVIVIAAYAVIALIDYRRIRKIPMTEALKNVE